jgi:hypothetical protein
MSKKRSFTILPTERTLATQKEKLVWFAIFIVDAINNGHLG